MDAVCLPLVVVFGPILFSSSSLSSSLLLLYNIADDWHSIILATRSIPKQAVDINAKDVAVDILVFKMGKPLYVEYANPQPRPVIVEAVTRMAMRSNCANASSIIILGSIWKDCWYPIFSACDVLILDVLFLE